MVEAEVADGSKTQPPTLKPLTDRKMRAELESGRGPLRDRGAPTSLAEDREVDANPSKLTEAGRRIMRWDLFIGRDVALIHVISGNWPRLHGRCPPALCLRPVLTAV